MCGICGVVNRDSGSHVRTETIQRMCSALAHRGPDDSGEIIEGPVGLGHRRLSILDLSARGHQPMTSKSGRFSITYNGEIYNYRDLRKELQKSGCLFNSDSDTEVLVEGLEHWGLTGLLSRLDGIFAFAAWDRSERRLLAARDPLGVKPFFYKIGPEQFLFASEMRGIWAAGAECSVDRERLEELLIFRFTAGMETPFKGVERLLPGHYLELNDGALHTQAYWRAIDHVDSDPSFVGIWQERFRQAVHDQLISDVPVGTLLSGGLDSSAVTVEVARSSDTPVRTFTVSIPPHEGVDEWPYAEAVAKMWKCESHKLQIPSGQVLERLRAAQAFHDEPFAFGQDMYIYEISRMAREHVTVVLSGEGADETLGGYTRYEPVRYPLLAKLATSFAAAPLRHVLMMSRSRKISRLGRMMSLSGLDDMIFYNAAGMYPDDLEQIGFSVGQMYEYRRGLIDEARRHTGEPIRQLMLYDIHTFLPALLDRNDRMTMAASLECRVPILAVGLVEAALKLPLDALFSGRQGKMVLRNHMKNLLPPDVLRRPKWGLGIPWQEYFRFDPACRAFVERLPQSGLAELMQAPGLAKAISGFLDGADRLFPIVYQTFMMAVWWEQIVEGGRQRTSAARPSLVK